MDILIIFLLILSGLSLVSNAPNTEDSNGCKHERDHDKTGLYSKEEHFENTQLFWLPSSTTHDPATAAVDTSRNVMYLRDVYLGQGQTFGTTATQALVFGGHSGSYATILNQSEGENTVADEHFAWFLSLLPDDAEQGTGVILEYSDCVSPLRVQQIADSISVSAGDNLQEFHSFTANNVFTGDWVNIALTYKVGEVDFKIIQFDVDDEALETLYPICDVDTSRRINATGDVRIGGSFDPALLSYSGKIRCFQFFKGYFLKNFESVPSYCRPEEDSDPSPDGEDRTMPTVELTKDEDPTSYIPARVCPGDQLSTTDPTIFSTTVSTTTTNSMKKTTSDTSISTAATATSHNPPSTTAPSSATTSTTTSSSTTTSTTTPSTRTTSTPPSTTTSPSTTTPPSTTTSTTTPPSTTISLTTTSSTTTPPSTTTSQTTTPSTMTATTTSLTTTSTTRTITTSTTTPPSTTASTTTSTTTPSTTASITTTLSITVPATLITSITTPSTSTTTQTPTSAITTTIPPPSSTTTTPTAITSAPTSATTTSLETTRGHTALRTETHSTVEVTGTIQTSATSTAATPTASSASVAGIASASFTDATRTSLAPIAPVNTCSSFQRVATQVQFPVGHNFSSVLATTLGQCAHACFSRPGCLAFGFDGMNCHLAQELTLIPNMSSGYDIYKITTT